VGPPWITSILSLGSRPDVLRIQLFVTRHTAKEIQPPSSDIETFRGRPNVDTLIGKEVELQAGAIVVSVSGTGGMADDVRRAVRKRQGVSNIDLVEESFSW
jgi:predicted oxidoreductase